VLPGVCVISMHHFVLTYSGLGFDANVQLPTRPVPEPVTACFDNRGENKLAPVITSVIHIFIFPSRHAQLTMQGKIRYMVRLNEPLPGL
jgi:hypothetical protein